MSTAYEVPLTAKSQIFQISMGGVVYTITLFWNQAAACWMINLDDGSNVPIIHGIPLVTGIDLLTQYAYLNLGGQLVVQTDYSPDVLPTLTNLGSESHLYFVVG